MYQYNYKVQVFVVAPIFPSSILCILCLLCCSNLHNYVWKVPQVVDWGECTYLNGDVVEVCSTWLLLGGNIPWHLFYFTLNRLWFTKVECPHVELCCCYLQALLVIEIAFVLIILNLPRLRSTQLSSFIIYSWWMTPMRMLAKECNLTSYISDLLEWYWIGICGYWHPLIVSSWGCS